MTRTRYKVKDSARHVREQRDFRSKQEKELHSLQFNGVGISYSRMKEIQEAFKFRR